MVSQVIIALTVPPVGIENILSVRCRPVESIPEMPSTLQLLLVKHCIHMYCIYKPYAMDH